MFKLVNARKLRWFYEKKKFNIWYLPETRNICPSLPSRHFKYGWNTTALRKPNCRNFSDSKISSNTTRNFSSNLNDTNVNYIYLINQAWGSYWEYIGPRSWQYGPRADILQVRSRASLVNKRFGTRLKKALKVFHKFHVTLCGKRYLARTRCFHRWSWFTIIRRAFENF